MEELLYWGAIAAFYLWSAYRSNQKKAKKLVPNQAPAKKDLKNPQIPNNTGNIGRLCVGSLSKLHLVKPLGFEITDSRIRSRARKHSEK